MNIKSISCGLIKAGVNHIIIKGGLKSFKDLFEKIIRRLIGNTVIQDDFRNI